ncbi:MAG: hypothetical protein K5753_04595 [Clostridia bacterium]|nr:hypothetical protein [Clostridia bacterium]
MDFVIIGLTVAFAVIGLIKGGAKLFFGLFMILVIAVGAAFISSLVCPLFLKTGKGNEVKFTPPATVLMNPIGNALPKGGEFGDLLDTPVKYKEDGALYVGEKALKEIVSEKVPYVGSFVAPLAEKAAVPSDSLRKSLSFVIVKYIYEFVVWLILGIALLILRNVIRKKIYRFLDHNSGPSKIDRVLGVIMMVAVLLAVFWGAGLAIAHFDDGEGNWAHTADTFLLNGVISEPLFKNNPLLKIINVTLPVTAAATE